MTMAKIFISHSAHRDPYAGEVLDELSGILKAKHYDVFVDRERVHAGEEWEKKLERWLDRCQFAIVLLSKDAFKSDWVHHEVEILHHRILATSEDQRITIIPVLVGHILPTRRIRLRRLKRLNELKLQYLSLPARMAAAEAAALIAARFAPLTSAQTPGEMKDWLKRVAYPIKQVKEESQRIAAAEKLGLSPEEASNAGNHEGPTFLAAKLLESGLSVETLRAVRELTPYMPLDARKQLIEEIAPSWVDARAASLIVGAEQNHLVAILNAQWPKTGDDYYDRATCRNQIDYWKRKVGMAPGGQGKDELLVEWRRVINEELFVTDESPTPDGVRCFLVVHRDDGTTLADVVDAILRIHADHPWLGFLLLTGKSMPGADVMRTWKLTNAVLLHPELDPSSESKARLRVEKLKELVAG